MHERRTDQADAGLQIVVRCFLAAQPGADQPALALFLSSYLSLSLVHCTTLRRHVFSSPPNMPSENLFMGITCHDEEYMAAAANQTFRVLRRSAATRFLEADRPEMKIH